MSQKNQKKKRPRTERREKERELRKEVRLRNELADLAVGGSADKPLRVQSASQVEAQASGLTCPLCDSVGLRVVTHAAEQLGDRRLRIVRAECRVCRIARDYYFELESPVLN